MSGVVKMKIYQPEGYEFYELFDDEKSQNSFIRKVKDFKDKVAVGLNLHFVGHYFCFTTTWEPIFLAKQGNEIHVSVYADKDRGCLLRKVIYIHDPIIPPGKPIVVDDSGDIGLISEEVSRSLDNTFVQRTCVE